MVTWLNALSKTRNRFRQKLREVFSSTTQHVDEDTLEELEEALITADVPVRLVAAFIETLEQGYKGLDVDARSMLSTLLADALGESASMSWEPQDSPKVILLAGVNGSGKTTTAAKLARRIMQQNCSVMLAATDTFRAAGSQQLKLWGDRLGCHTVTGQQGADAAAVAFDAISAAQARQTDYVLVDTAGRMHTRQPLMQELDKVSRSMKKNIPEAPHQAWIVLDASMGQNAVIQARMFNDIIPLSGAVITKLDGSSKAGFVFSIRKELNIPIYYAGLGEHEDDLVPFDPPAFTAALLGINAEEPD